MCNDVKAWYVEQLQIIENDPFAGKVFRRKLLTIGKAGIGVAGGILMMMNNSNLRHAGQRTAQAAINNGSKELNEISPEKYRAEAKERLEIEYQQKLDLKCQEIAQKMLT